MLLFISCHHISKGWKEGDYSELKVQRCTQKLNSRGHDGMISDSDVLWLQKIKRKEKVLI